MWNPGIYVELNIAGNSLILLAISIKPARIVSEVYAKSKRMNVLNAGMERVNSEYAAIAKKAAVPDQDETARNIAIATITAAKINEDRAAAAATKLLKGLKFEGGTVYGILAGTPSRGISKPTDPKYEQSPPPLYSDLSFCSR